MRYFKFLFLLTGLSMSCFIVAASAHAGHGSHRVDTDSRLSGNALEHQFWASVQNHDAHALSELISPAFLGGNSLGSCDCANKLKFLQYLSIDSFSITNVVESQEDDIRIISYDFMTTGAYPFSDHRISVWQRKKHKHHQFFWQLISQFSFSANP